MVETNGGGVADHSGASGGVGLVDQELAFSCIRDVRREHAGVTRLDLDIPTTQDGQWFLLASDVHFDNAHTDRALFKLHLDQAVERRAGILLVGDTHCAMQGKWDKRSDRSALREEYQHGPYLDRLVDELAGFLEPYAKNIVHISDGNHETAISKHHETDLTERTVGALRSMGSPVIRGGYTGWLYLACTMHSTKRGSLGWWYTHGYGGGGPVTKDMIQRNRQLAYIEGADLMFSGHTHDRWSDDNVRLGLDFNGKQVRRVCEYLKLGTYKDEHGEGQGGWSVGRGIPPKPLGAYWVRVAYSKRRGLHMDTSKAN